MTLKTMAAGLFLITVMVSSFAQDTTQGSTQPSSTDIMGGGTPGREDADRLSKEMYEQQRRQDRQREEERKRVKKKKDPRSH